MLLNQYTDLACEPQISQNNKVYIYTYNIYVYGRLKNKMGQSLPFFTSFLFYYDLLDIFRVVRKHIKE